MKPLDKDDRCSTAQKAGTATGHAGYVDPQSAFAGPMLHGYGIGQRIEQLAQDMLQVEEGTLYPALYRIENRGWIKGEWGVSTNNRRACFYKLTRAGRKQLSVEESQWEYVPWWQTVQDDSGRDRVLRRFFLHVLPKGFVRIRHFGSLANRSRPSGARPATVGLRWFDGAGS